MSSLKDKRPVTVVGAGLAGCEAAVKLAKAGICVDLMEMKPANYSSAHCLQGPAELVCSNSLKSDSLDTAHGLLKAEMRDLGSVVMDVAQQTRVPAGSALAVDRRAFSDKMHALLQSFDNIRYHSGKHITALPEGDVIIATGPLTSKELASRLQNVMGVDKLHFYDALAPIIEAESIDTTKVFEASRWGKGESSDYLNCPLTKDEYLELVHALRSAQKTPLHEFERIPYFEGCLPVEVMAERGDNVLAFGPMRPIGLECDGKRPFAVVQLRSENREKTAYNMVGFQTKLTHSAQREVFRRIPGLQRVEFLRYGAVHMNMFVNSPEVLTDSLGLLSSPKIRLAGQILGVEGYVESAAMGLLVGLVVAKEMSGEAFSFPPEDTAIGALYRHVRTGRGAGKDFEPMNIHFGLLPNTGLRGRKERRRTAIERARQSMQSWMQTVVGSGREPM